MHQSGDQGGGCTDSVGSGSMDSFIKNFAEGGSDGSVSLSNGSAKFDGMMGLDLIDEAGKMVSLSTSSGGGGVTSSDSAGTASSSSFMMKNSFARANTHSHQSTEHWESRGNRARDNFTRPHTMMNTHIAQSTDEEHKASKVIKVGDEALMQELMVEGGGELDGDKVDIDGVLQVQRRKVQRRQANRKSAQLSRARKKAQLEHLMGQNERLQRIAGILEAHPDIIFSTRHNGDVTYISERARNLIVIAGQERGSFHVNQILHHTSVDTFFETLQTLSQQYIDSNGNAELEAVNSVFETTCPVEYLNREGKAIPAVMRCTRLMHRSPAEGMGGGVEGSSGGEGEVGDGDGNDCVAKAPPSKKRKSQQQQPAVSTAVDPPILQHATVLSRLAEAQEDISSLDEDNSCRSKEQHNTQQHKCVDVEKFEFVCNLRPLTSPEGLTTMSLMPIMSSSCHRHHRGGARGGEMDFDAHGLNDQDATRGISPSDDNGTSSNGTNSTSKLTSHTAEASDDAGEGSTTLTASS